MHRNLSRSHIHHRRAGLIASLFTAGILVGTAMPARASFYQLTDLTTDDQNFLTSLGLPPAANVDTNLINPWGVSHSATSPFWVSDNGTGVSTLHTGVGTPLSLVVTIAPPLIPPPGFTNSTPTGQVRNPGAVPSGFNVTAGGQSAPSQFIFATEDGTISGWNPTVNPTNSIIAVDNSKIPTAATGAVYKGLAVAPDGSQLYAANFRAGTVEVYDSTFTLKKTITDPTVPAGYAPFNVQVLNGKLYVSFALQDAAKHDDVAGAGHGFVDVFNLDGTGMQRLISNGVLDSPWGLDIAPSSFGAFANDLLVGNFGSDPGTNSINVFDPITGAFLGALTDASGMPIEIEGLWALANGNGGPAPNGSDPNAVYFTAGIGDEMHGLFGELTVVPEPGSLVLFATGLAGLMWLRRRRAVATRPPAPAVG
jgi:uncharacterized protein (TIGR03118 family)